MKIFYYTSILVLIGIIFISGCLGPGEKHVTPEPEIKPVYASPENGTNASPGDVMIDANNRFAFDLYANLSQSPDNTGKNLFFSPYSISTAFALASEGAKTQTAGEIRTVFHLPEKDLIRREGTAEVYERLNHGGAGYTLHTANALWAEKTYPFLPAYTGMAKKYYAADTVNLDFRHDLEGSRAAINAWTENQTEGKIRNLLPAGSIKTVTELVLTNAVYFEGSWMKEFSKNETAISRFHRSTGNDVEVPLMFRGEKETVLGYGETDDLQVLQMPYSRGDKKPVSMLVLLPKSGDLAAAESALNPEGLARIRASLGYRHVDVYFPKFTLDTSYELPGTLRAMGMPAAFSRGADFSGMDGTNTLYLDEVVHTAHAEVTEEGTYSAAASARAMIVKGPPPAYIPVQFRADHPFVFLIWDDETGNILFMGRVVDPSQPENEQPVMI